MKQKNTILFNLVLIGVSLILVSLLIFFFNGDGFVAKIYSSLKIDEVSFSREYHSSGSDDDGVILFIIFGRVFIILLCMFLLTYKLSFFLYVVGWFFELVGLLIVSDTSDIFKTIHHDIFFALWFVFWFLSLPLSTLVYFVLQNKNSVCSEHSDDNDLLL